MDTHFERNFGRLDRNLKISEESIGSQGDCGSSSPSPGVDFRAGSGPDSGIDLVGHLLGPHLSPIERNTAFFNEVFAEQSAWAFIGGKGRAEHKYEKSFASGRCRFLSTYLAETS